MFENQKSLLKCLSISGIVVLCWLFGWVFWLFFIEEVVHMLFVLFPWSLPESESANLFKIFSLL